MRDEDGDGLVYVGDDNTVSVYHLYLENRVVLHVLVDNADPQLRIGFARPNWWQIGEPVRFRDGHAVRGLHSYKVGPEESDVEVREHILSESVQGYVYTYTPWLLADAYAPKNVSI